MFTTNDSPIPAIDISDEKDQRIAALESELNGLKETYRAVAQRDYTTAANYNAMKQELRKWTLAELASDDLTTRQADELASIGGFSLELTYNVTATVSYDLTITVEPGEDIDDVIANLDFENVESYSAEVTHISASVDSIDYELEND